MGLWESLKAWFVTEATEAKDAKDDLERRLSSELDRRERILDETPTEAMERLEGEIAAGEATFDAIGDKIGDTGAKAQAKADLESSEDILDLPSEEVDAPEP